MLDIIIARIIYSSYDKTHMSYKLPVKDKTFFFYKFQNKTLHLTEN